MEAPTAEELGPLIDSGSATLDEPAADPYADEDGEFMAAATAAVGDERKATALQDAIESCLRKHGLIGGVAPGGELVDDDLAESDVGVGFPDM